MKILYNNNMYKQTIIKENGKYKIIWINEKGVIINLLSVIKKQKNKNEMEA